VEATSPADSSDNTLHHLTLL